MPDYGISWDESAERMHGFISGNYILEKILPADLYTKFLDKTINTKFSDLGNIVYCVDKDQNKIELLIFSINYIFILPIIFFIVIKYREYFFNFIYYWIILKHFSTDI